MTYMLIQAAVAQATLAYQLYQKKFSGPRWEVLVKKGAKKQRVLWASTSVKNPSYPDTLYVDPLIGPDTVSVLQFWIFFRCLEMTRYLVEVIQLFGSPFYRFQPCRIRPLKHLLTMEQYLGQ